MASDTLNSVRKSTFTEIGSSNRKKKFGFSKSERLHKTKEFIEVYKKGKAYQSDHLLLFVLARGQIQGIPGVRIGIVVSRKVGKAVKRNKIKRRLREIFRLNKHLLKPGFDIVVNAKNL
ncbi:MAG: ribonuclease P protein component [Endomicrobiia bacterium]